jgi:divalent metal cation (Fe/Co/Zn/Cd) transporter
MVEEKKRDMCLLLAMSFFTGIGFMSIVNIIKTMFNQHPIIYDWIMLVVSIIIISVCLLLYFTKRGRALEEKIIKYR